MAGADPARILPTVLADRHLRTAVRWTDTVTGKAGILGHRHRRAAGQLPARARKSAVLALGNVPPLQRPEEGGTQEEEKAEVK